MGSTKKILATLPAAFLAASVAYTGSATAADLLVDPPVYEAPEIVTKSSGGWYLRGDITYDFSEVKAPSYRNTAAWGVGNTAFTSSDTGNAFDLGVGIGYQVNDYFRVDLTGEYVFETDFTATSGCPTTCAAVDTSSFTTTKILANAYAELGNYSGFTPYVGVGLGLSIPHVEVAGPAVGGTTTEEYQVTGVAVQALVGVDFAIDENWSVFGELKSTYGQVDADLNGGGNLDTHIMPSR